MCSIINRIAIALMLMLSVATTAAAQRLNRLWIPQCGGTASSTIQVYINLDNTDQATAFQFDLTAPAGYKFGSEFIKCDRLDDTHHVGTRLMTDNKIRVIGYAVDNAPIRGNSGALGYLTLTIANNAVEGGEYEIAMDNATLSDAQLNDVLTETANGLLAIGQMPDLEVSGVATTATAANPGDELTVSWMVSNIGSRPYQGNWAETVKGIGPDGRVVVLYAGYADVDGLGGGASLHRQAQAVIPKLPGIDGEVTLMVEVTSGTDSGESMGTTANNSAKSAQAFSLGKRLILDIDKTEINEGGYRAKCTLYRSGSWAETQTFAIENSNVDRLSCPENVRISAHYSSAVFYVYPIDNQKFDGDMTAVVAASGNGYDPVCQQIAILDNDMPDFEISVLSDKVPEGSVFQLVLDLGCERESETTVSLATDAPNLIDLPRSVAIPAGTASVTLTIPVYSNPEITGDATVAILATTDLHPSCSDAVTIIDADMPELVMRLSADVIYQGAEDGTFYVTISRVTNIDKPLLIEFSDDSNGMLAYPSATVEMAAGQADVTVPLSVDDKKINGGEMVSTLTAAVRIKACGCSASAESAGSVSKTLTIIDPSQSRLTLTCLDVLTSKTRVCPVTLRRNLDHSSALTVGLSAQAPVILPATVTIPAGRESVTFDAQLDSAFDQGAGVAKATAVADGYYNGSCLLPYAAEPMPDANIRLEFISDRLTAGGNAALRVVIGNNGDAPMSQGTSINIDSKGITEPIAMELPVDILAGESKSFEIETKLVEAAGTFNVVGLVNASRAVKEVTYANNSVSVWFSVAAPFTVVASTDRAAYRPGETISISGQAQGSGVGNSSVDIYIMGNNGSLAQASVMTDVNGSFTYTTEAKHYGAYSVFACYRGAIPDLPQASFDIIGLRVGMPLVYLDLTQNDIYEGEITLTNPTSVMLSGLTISCDTAHGGQGIEMNIAHFDGIEPGNTVKVPYAITAEELTPTNETVDLSLVIRLGQQEVGNMTMKCRVRPQMGRIEADVPEIDIAVANGEVRDYTFNIINSGAAETGTITLSLPDDVKSLTPITLLSLKPGEIAPVSLRFAPTSKLSETFMQQGVIYINCSQGRGLTMPYRMAQVSTKVGTLKLKVTDEYAYYNGDGERIDVENVFDRQGIAGAAVELIDALTGQTVLTSTSDQCGNVTVDVTSGQYILNVSAEMHSSLSANIFIEPGIDNEMEAFCSYDAIRFSWQVTETEIEDSYEMKAVAEFTTMVPKPVVTIDYPEDGVPILQPFYITVTNHGLVEAFDINAELDVRGDLTAVPLSDTYLGKLGAGEATVIEALLIPNEILDKLSGRREVMRKFREYDMEDLWDIISGIKNLKDLYDGFQDDKWWLYCFFVDTKLTMNYIGCRQMSLEQHNTYARINQKCYDEPDSPGILGEIINCLAPKTTATLEKHSNGGGGSFIPCSEFGGPGGGAYEVLPNIAITNGPCGGQSHAASIAKALGRLGITAVKIPAVDDAACASIMLEFKQEIAITRQAFRGALSIFNGMDVPMTDIKVMLTITDSEGQPATRHIIDVSTEAIEGFGVDTDGLWTVEAGGIGSARYLFIPTSKAAPTAPEVYTFGGYLSFADPQTGMSRTVPLRPVEMTVAPTPEFDLTYFMQRDVFGDDPLTDEVEASVPAEFSLLVRNVGCGEAKGLKITTAQPEIIENEKGLNITYSIVSAQLNGADQNLALGQSVTTDFGSIPAKGTAYAQWWMESSLLGHFVDYDFSLNHLSSQDNPSLSLIRDASLHELIRGLRFTDAEGMPQRAFLANDMPDDESHPDAAYLTDGTVSGVWHASMATIAQVGETQYELSVVIPESLNEDTWIYGYVVDPAVGRQKVINVKRLSDGYDIDPYNFWTTDRTLYDYRKPVYENRLHFGDRAVASGVERYLIEFAPRQSEIIDIDHIAASVSDLGATTDPVDKIVVYFNVCIKPSSVRLNDNVVLTLDGVPLALAAEIVMVGDDYLEIRPKDITGEAGVYQLVIDCTRIQDADGYAGYAKHLFTWTKDELDSVPALMTDPEREPAYDLLGRPINPASYRGIVIRKGASVLRP